MIIPYTSSCVPMGIATIGDGSGLTAVPNFVVQGNTQYGVTLVTNLDTITKAGFYTCYGTATGAPNTNYSWFVQHQNSSTGTVYATQRAVAFDKDTLIAYERIKATTWGTWQQIETAKLFDIKTVSQNVAEKGFAYLCNDTATPLAKADIPTAYANKKSLYDNAELVVTSWQAGISSLRNGYNYYGGLCSHAGKYYIGQENGLFYTTDYIVGELTQINNVITSDIYCFDNIIIQRNAGGGLNKIDYETLTTTSILSFSGQKPGGSLKCHKEDDGYIYITDASLFTVHRILDATDAEIELVYTHGTTAVYDCRKKGTKFIIAAADGIYTTSDFVTLSLKYAINLNGATLLYHVATNKFIVVPFNEWGDVPVYTSVDEFENTIEVATGVSRNARTAYLNGNNLYIPAVGGDPYNASYYTQTVANIAVGWERVAISNTNITWMTFIGTTILAIVSDKLYYSGLVKQTYTDTYNVDGTSFDITYYLGSDNSKIVFGTSQDTNLAKLYTQNGFVPYFVLNTTAETLTLMRIKNKWTVMYVGDNFEDTSVIAGVYDRPALLSETQKNLFSQIDDKTIEATDVETSIVGTGDGSLTLPANFFTQGKTITIKGWGFLSGVNGETTTVKVKLGSTDLLSSTSTLPTALTNVLYEFSMNIVCRSSGSTGTLMAEGATVIYAGQAIVTLTGRPLSMTTPVTVDTTAAQLLDITYKFGTNNAANKIVTTIIKVTE